MCLKECWCLLHATSAEFVVEWKVSLVSLLSGGSWAKTSAIYLLSLSDSRTLYCATRANGNKDSLPCLSLLRPNLADFLRVSLSLSFYELNRKAGWRIRSSTSPLIHNHIAHSASNICLRFLRLIYGFEIRRSRFIIHQSQAHKLSSLHLHRFPSPRHRPFILLCSFNCLLLLVTSRKSCKLSL